MTNDRVALLRKSVDRRKNPVMETGFDPDARVLFDAMPDPVRPLLLCLRGMIFQVAGECVEVGEIVETVKWNEPAYVTRNPCSGTTIRLNASKGSDRLAGLFVHCQTDLIEKCRELYGSRFEYDKNRGLIFEPGKALPEDELRHFIAMALTYHVK